MKIKDFVDKYNKVSDKEQYIKEHIVRTYLGYLNKVDLCDRVIKASCYKEVMGRQVFYMNTPAQYMLFVMAIIYKYTDIEQGVSIVLDFDFLDQHGLVDALIANISDGEYETLQALLEMMVGDVMENERSLISYFDNKLDAMGMSMDALGEALGDMLGDAIEESAEERDG